MPLCELAFNINLKKKKTVILSGRILLFIDRFSAFGNINLVLENVFFSSSWPLAWSFKIHHQDSPLN